MIGANLNSLANPFGSSASSHCFHPSANPSDASHNYPHCLPPHLPPYSRSNTPPSASLSVTPAAAWDVSECTEDVWAKYERQGTLGSGSFGTVYLARERGTSVLVAIKKIEI